MSATNPREFKKKYNTHSMTLHLNIAKKTKDKNYFQDYIRWWEAYVEHSPFPFIYYDLTKSYEAIGDKEKPVKYSIKRNIYSPMSGGKTNQNLLPNKIFIRIIQNSCFLRI